MGAGPMTRDLHPISVADFLRREAFYLVVVLFVLGASIPPTLRVFTGAEEPVDTWQQVTLRGGLKPPLWVARLHLGLTIVGIAVGVVCIAAAAAWRRFPRVDSFVQPAWGLWDCLKLGACWRAGSYLFHAILDTGVANPLQTPLQWVADILGRILLVGVLVNIVVADRGSRLSDVGIRRQGILRAAAIGLTGFLVFHPVGWHVLKLQNYLFPRADLQDAVNALLKTNSASVLVFGVVVAVVAAPISEELFFRGFLQPTLQRWFGGWTGLTLCAALFAVYHDSIYVMVPLFLLGLVLGYVHNRARSAVAPIVLHMAYNAIGILVVLGSR